MEALVPDFNEFTELRRRQIALRERLDELQNVAQALEIVPTDIIKRVMAPTHRMLLVPATLVHTNEVLVPLPDGRKEWKTAPQARALAIRYAAEVETELAGLAVRMREQGIDPLGGTSADEPLPPIVAHATQARQLAHKAMELGKGVRKLGPNATEVDVDGEKLVYIEEFEETPVQQDGPALQSIATAAGVGKAQNLSDAERKAWQDFEAKMAAAEAAERAAEAAAAPTVREAPTARVEMAAQQPAAAPAPATAPKQTTIGRPITRSGILGNVTERSAPAAVPASAVESLGAVQAAAGAPGEAPAQPSRPVSKFKLERMGKS